MDYFKFMGTVSLSKYTYLNLQNSCIQKYCILWSLSILKSVILSNSSFVGRHFEAILKISQREENLPSFQIHIHRNIFSP